MIHTTQAAEKQFFNEWNYNLICGEDTKGTDGDDSVFIKATQNTKKNYKERFDFQQKSAYDFLGFKGKFFLIRACIQSKRYANIQIKIYSVKNKEWGRTIT